MSWSTAPAVATPRMMARTLGTFHVFGGVAGLLAVSGAGAAPRAQRVMVAFSLSGLVSAGVAFRFGPRWSQWFFHVPVGSATCPIAIGVLMAPDPILARQGGDESALLLPGLTGGAALTPVRRITALHPQIGPPVGVAEHSADQTGADLVRRADRALHDAEAAGRGRAELAGGPGSELARDLAAALPAGDVQVHDQPVVALPDAALVGVEALARWTRPELGSVPRAEFVAVAQQADLVVQA